VTVSNDTTAPTLSSGSPSTAQPSGTTDVTLSLTTDETATCKYGTTANTAYASIINTFSTTAGTSHSQAITGLTNNTSYTYYARCIDTAGNANTTDYEIAFSVDAVAVAEEPVAGKPSSRRRGTTVPAPTQSNAAADTNTDTANTSIIDNLLTSLKDLISKGSDKETIKTFVDKLKAEFETLFKLMEEGSKNMTPYNPSAPTTFTTDLELNTVHPDVLLLQQFLNNNGYIVSPFGAGSIGNETNTFGPATQAALIKFQQANNISPSVGYFGSVTREVVNAPR